MTPYTEYLRRVIAAVESLPPEWRGAVFSDAPGLGGSFRLHARGEPLSGATWARRAYDTGSYPAEWSVTLGDVTVFGCATAEEAAAWGCPPSLLAPSSPEGAVSPAPGEGTGLGGGK